MKSKLLSIAVTDEERSMSDAGFSDSPSLLIGDIIKIYIC
jgi:hypothetical protein